MKSSQKLLVGCVFWIGLLVLFPQIVSAHSPQSMTLNYTASSNTLSVSITHNVGDPSSHYINNVKIENSSEVITSPNYTSQPSSSSFIYEYQLPVTDGENITITATCNLGGSISRSLIINLTSTTSINTTTTTTNGNPPDPSNSLLNFPHFILIFIGLIMMMVGIIFIYLHKPKTWFLLHKIFTGGGVGLAILGILILPLLSLNLVHSIIGLIGAIGMVICILTGYIFKQKKKKSIRMSHIWQGRIYFLVMLIAAFIGLYLYGVFN